MMKAPKLFAVCGDWHEDLGFARRQVASLHYRGVDCIIHVGDFGYSFSELFLDSLNYTLRHAGITLYFVDGNHENFHVLYTYEVNDEGLRPIRSNIIHLPRGFRWEWHNVVYMGLGGAVSVDKLWRGTNEWWPEEEISYYDFEVATEGGEVDIMFTHDCPTGVEIPGITGNPYGFPEHMIKQADRHRDTLRSVLDIVKPYRLYHGHYHRRYDAELIGKDYRTKIIGLDMNAAPWYDNVVIIDPTTFSTISGKDLENM